MQPQVLADGVQEPFERQDWHPEGGTAQGRAARGGLPGEHRGAVRARAAVHAQGRHAEVRRLRVRHTAPERRVQPVRVQGPAAQRQHQTEPGRMAEVRVRVLIRPRADAPGCSIVSPVDHDVVVTIFHVRRRFSTLACRDKSSFCDRNNIAPIAFCTP